MAEAKIMYKEAKKMIEEKQRSRAMMLMSDAASLRCKRFEVSNRVLTGRGGCGASQEGGNICPCRRLIVVSSSSKDPKEGTKLQFMASTAKLMGQKRALIFCPPFVSFGKSRSTSVLAVLEIARRVHVCVCACVCALACVCVCIGNARPRGCCCLSLRFR